MFFFSAISILSLINRKTFRENVVYVNDYINFAQF